jgi:hypothetical protein
VPVLLAPAGHAVPVLLARRACRAVLVARGANGWPPGPRPGEYWVNAVGIRALRWHPRRYRRERRSYRGMCEGQSHRRDRAVGAQRGRCCLLWRCFLLKQAVAVS